MTKYTGESIFAQNTGKGVVDFASLDGNYYQDLSLGILKGVERPVIRTTDENELIAFENRYNITLRKIDDTIFDVADLVNGSIVRKTSESKFMGIENWELHELETESTVFKLNQILGKKVISNLFDNNDIYIVENTLYVRISNTKIQEPTVYFFKEYLSFYNLICFFELETYSQETFEIDTHLQSLDGTTYYTQTQNVKGYMNFDLKSEKTFKSKEVDSNTLYIFDKHNLKIKQIATIASFKINNDDETNGKSEFTIKRETSLKKGDILFAKKQYFIIEEVKEKRNVESITVVCKDIVHIFDRKLIERYTDDMLSKSLEHFIKTTIDREFAQASDPILAIPYLQTTIATNTQVKEPTNSENMIYNFKTFLVNCRQNRNIYTNFEIVQGAQNKLVITISNVEIPQVLIDTTLNDVTDYNKIYEVEPVVKVSCYCQDTQITKTMYLRADFTTTYDINDSLRITGLTESISVEEEENAEDEMLNVFKSNRYQHYVEFKIRKKSNLVDTSKIQVGTPVKIKTFGIDTEFDVYDSYISAVAFSDAEFISYKSGRLRVTLTDKLAQKML